MALPDWALSLEDDGQEGLPAGSTLVYELIIRNDAFGAANDAGPTSVTITVAPGTTMVDGGGLLNCQILGVPDAPVICDVPAIPASGSLTFMPEILTTIGNAPTLVVTIPPAGDSNPANNSASQQTTLSDGADIELSVVGPPGDEAASGSIVDYTFTALNNGPNNSQGFDFSFPIPAGLDNITPPAGCVLNGSTYDCFVPGVVLDGASVNLVFSGQITSGDGSTVTVSGSVGNGTPLDGVSDNNVVSLDTDVTAGSDLSISKTISDDALLVGETAIFTLSAQFSGDNPTGILLTDTIPGNYTVLSINTSGTAWDCSASAGNGISCSQPAGPGGGANVPLGDIEIEVEAISDTGGVNVANTATVAADGPVDPNPDNNTDSDGGVDIQSPFVDHQANKTGPPEGLVAVGSEYPFSISSTNIGNAAFFGTLRLVDTVPSGADYTSVLTNGWTCTPAPTQSGLIDITCTIVYTDTNPLLPGEQTPQVVTGITATSTGPLVNSLRVDAPVANIEDLEGPNDVITYGVTGLDADASPDIEVIKTASATTVASGDTISFTLEVLNNGSLNPPGGDVDAEGVVVTDDLRNLINNVEAAGGGLESITIDAQGATGITCSSIVAGSRGRDLTCNIDTLPICNPGACPTITVVVRPGGNPGTRRNTAEITSTITADADPNNNTSGVNYNVTGQTDVTVDKTATPDPSAVGQDVVYVITAQNRPVDANGDRIVLSTASLVEITDTLPDDVTFVSATATGGGTCTTLLNPGDTTDGTNNDVVCSWASIPNNRQQTATITVRPNNETLLNLPTPTIDNNVVISTSTPETDVTNNSDNAEIGIVVPAYDLLINKKDNVDPIAVGDDFFYTVTATNAGPSAAENIVIVDNMPASGVGYTNFVDGNGVTCSVTDPGVAPVNTGFGNLAVEVTCTVDYLAAGESASFDIYAKGDTKGSAVNNATVSADGSGIYQTNTDNDSIMHTTTVRSRVDVRVNSKMPSAPEVNLGEEFYWTIIVENVRDDDVPYGIAEGVVVSDELPPNMELAGTPTVTSPGVGTCTGVDTDDEFTCSVGNAGGVAGSMAIGEIISINVPVRVTAITTDGQSFENTAEIETQGSFDVDPGNNEGSGSVIVNAGSISGIVFRDFADNGLREGTDTIVDNRTIRITLSGTDLNGNIISEFIDTTDGTYNFDLLPAGTYTVTRGPVPEPFTSDGQNTPGTGSTAYYTALTSPDILLGGDEDAPGYDFAIVPQARVGLAKRVLGTPALNADGTFDTTFVFVIENFSLEPIENVSITDTLTGGAPRFGNHTGASTNMDRGTFTVITPPTSACGTAEAGYTGVAGTDTVMSAGIIPAGDTCEVSFRIRISPDNPLPTGTPQYENTATVDATGQLSGQTSADNGELSDVSDDGTDPDTGGDNAGGGSGENTPTPVNVEFVSTVELTKTVDTSAFADPLAPVEGELVTYTYIVTNPNSFNIFDISVAETAPGAAGDPPAFTGTGTPPVIGAASGGADIDGDSDLPDLAPGASVITYTATYAITQADINAGFVQNTATVTATDVYGDEITDSSDDSNVVDGVDYNGDGNPDDPTIAPLPRVAELSLVKSILSESFSDPLVAGDSIQYQVIVTNDGNVDIDNVAITDPGPSFNGVAANNGPVVFTTSDPVLLNPNGTATFTGTYTLNATDVANFGTAASPADAMVNVADATGDAPTGTTLVTETGTTETGIDPAPAITLTKEITTVTDTNGNGIIGDAGDEILYDLDVTNTGNTSLAMVQVTDGKLGLTNAPLTAPTAGANLAPGESGAIEDLSYTITIEDQGVGRVVNTATVVGTPVATNTDGTPDPTTTLVDGDGAPVGVVEDTSDTRSDPDLDDDGNVLPADDPDGDGNDNETVLNLPVLESEVTITKRVEGVADTNMNGLIGDAEDIITYTLVVTNTGDTSLANVMAIDGLLGVSQNVGDLAAGGSVTITDLEYMISIADQANRVVENQANASGTPVATGPGNVPITDAPLVDENGDEFDAVLDDSDTLTDPDLDGDGNVADVDNPSDGGVDDPTFVNLPATGPEITITKAIADVIDVNGNGQFGDAGDQVVYDFVVTNTGNTSLAGVTITDTMLDPNPMPVAPANLAPGDEGFVSGVTYTITPLDQAGEVLENSATTSGRPVVTSPDGTPDPTMTLVDDNGDALPPATDTSDTLTDPDLNGDGDPVDTNNPSDGGVDDPTLLNLPILNPEITLKKEIVEVFDTNNTGLFGDAGDTVQYQLTVTNTGNTSLAGITITDAVLGLNMVPVSPSALIPGGQATLTPALYTVTLLDYGRGEIENTAEAFGDPVVTGPGNVPVPGSSLVGPDGTPLEAVSDVSDTQTDPDLDDNNAVVDTANPDTDGLDDPTLLNLPEIAPELTLTKAIVDVEDVNGNTLFGDVGDLVTYTFTITNTGNTALAGVTVSDNKLGISNFAITPADLGIGQSVTLTAADLPALVYTIDREDQAAGQLENTATTQGQPVATDPDTGLPDPDAELLGPDGSVLPPVEDTSDTQTDPEVDENGVPFDTTNPDGNGPDDPTLLNLPPTGPEITLVKAITDVIDVNGNGLLGDTGDRVIYTLTVTNTGNTSLAGVTISDAKLGLVNVAVSPANLAPGDTASLTGQPYTITALDQGAGEVVNTATTEGQPVATGENGEPLPGTVLLDPDTGEEYAPVTDTSDTLTEPELDDDGNPVDVPSPSGDGPDTPTVLVLPDIEAEIELTKAITDVRDTNGNGLFGDVGDVVVYDFTVTNTGNASLDNVGVFDELLGLENVLVSPSALAPGESGELNDQLYTITPTDQAAGSVLNTAMTQGQLVATNPDGTPDTNTPLVDAGGEPFAPVEDISDTLTDPDLDADGNPVLTADPDGDGPDNPTVVNLPAVEPEITLTKAITDVRDTNGNGLFGDVGDVVVYDFTVTNTGNTSLANVTVTDELLGLEAVLVTPDALAPDAQGTLVDQLYTITPADQAAGSVLNTATTSGAPVATGPDGLPDTDTPLIDPATGEPFAPVEDTSDTLTDPDLDEDGNPVLTADPDGDGPDNPTVVNLPAVEPEITLTKAITDVRDTNGNGLFGDVGDVVVYDFTVTNTGNTSLANVTVTDELLGLEAVLVTPDALAPDAQGTLVDQLYTITPADQAAGSVLNTATTSGAPVATGPDGLPDTDTPLIDPATGEPFAPVEDISDTLTDPDLDADGNPVLTADPDGDGPDNPTVVNLPAVEPEITLTKAITDVRDTNGNGLFGDVGDVVVYDFTVTNTGNTSLANVTVTDELLGLEAVLVTPDALAPDAQGTLVDQLYTITPADQAAGSVLNTATTSGAPVATGPDGLPDTDTPLIDPATGEPFAPVEDISDTLTDPDLDADGNPVLTADPDGDGPDNPTVVNLPAVEPEITLVKAVAQVLDTNEDLVLGNVGDTITYLFTATNTGNTSLSNVLLNDPLLEIVNAPMDPDVLAVDESATFTAELVINEDQFEAGFVENTATSTGAPVATGPDGRPLTDAPLVNPDGSPLDPVSDVSDTGSQADTEDDGTIIPVETPAEDGGPDDPTVLNVPLVLSPLSVSGTVFLDTNKDGVLDGNDDPNAGAGYTINLLDPDGNVVASVVTDANGFYEIAGFPAGVYTVQFVDPQGLVAGVSDELAFNLETPTYEGIDFPIIVEGGASITSLTISKVVANRITDVRFGDVVPYRIEVANSDPALVGPATVVDRLPPGLVYVPGSAQVDGVAATPVRGGPQLTFSELFVPGNGSVIITLSARVGPAAPTGNLVNTATLFDGTTGDVIAPVAEAIVRRVPEHVFDCSDVIGTVFDDRNRNGYQDGVVRDTAITNQDYLGGKGKAAPAPVISPTGEPGLAGVRVATVNGTLITTDAHGRFHVPCAELPSKIGTNFILKVDERSLPSGYRLTTENPRVVRLTAGKFAKMNFGAAIGRVIDINIAGNAFVDGVQPTDKLQAAVRNLSRTLRSEPSIVRLSYIAGSNAEVKLGRARMRAVEKLLKREWRRNGTHKLTVEKTIKRRQ